MDISKIKIGSTTYDIKDSVARAAMTNGTHFIGILKTDSEVEGAATSVVDGGAPNIIETSLGVYTKGTAGDNQVQLAAGDILMVASNGTNQNAPKEFIWDGSKFQELGSTGSLQDLAFKSSASGSYTPAGSNADSAVSFSGTQTSNFVTGIDTAAVAPSFTEGTFSAGTLPSFTEGAFNAGSLPSLGEATTGSFATEGVTAEYVSANETLELSAASTSSAVTAQGTFSAGSLPSKAADTWDAGSLPSKDADSFSAGSAATFSTAAAITNLGTATAAAQTFTGTAATISVA
jgi:hypothetical protein